MQKKSFGVIIVGLLVVLYSLGFYLSGFWKVINKQDTIKTMIQVVLFRYTKAPWIMVIEIFLLLTGIGIICLKEWARKSIIIFSILYLLISIWKIDSVYVLYSFIMNLIFCFYLTRKRIKELFK